MDTPTTKVTVNDEMLQQMEALTVGQTLHLLSDNGPKQYFVIRLPDAVEGNSP